MEKTFHDFHRSHCAERLAHSFHLVKTQEIKYCGKTNKGNHLDNIVHTHVFEKMYIYIYIYIYF